MLIRLTLKGDATIGGSRGKYQAHQPLNKVEEVEADVPQLFHLRSMYLLMVDRVRRHRLTLTHEANTE
jgi:hypothetical protein